MLLCLDVHYGSERVTTAAVGFAAWPDDTPRVEWVLHSQVPPAPYRPGHFFERELPYLLEAVKQLSALPEAIVVDGHVWLASERPGLGAHLHAALGRTSIVVGVAKSAFRGADSVPVLRGRSHHPLFVDAAGVDPATAAGWVRSMHGPHRIPTLLRRVDRLARGLQSPDPTRSPAAS